MPIKQTRVEIESIEPYVAGEFYRRELPCLLAALEDINTSVDGIIVDSYVDLPNRKPGMGRYLYGALDQTVPVIGVAKTEFSGTDALPLLRGESEKPLFITAVGIEPQMALEMIRQMHGNYRFPTLLRYVDQLARGTLAEG